MKEREPVIVSAVRTPIGTFGGVFREVLNSELSAVVINEVCRRVSYPKEDLDDIYWGVVMVRSDENGMARSAALMAGVPEYVSAVQVNRACCSSMEAIRLASMAVRLGEASAIIAGGSESMSNVPYSLKNARWGLRLRHQEFSDGIWDGLTDHHTGLIMGMTAENVAEKYHITREEQDRFAWRSQMRTKKAMEEGRFKDEIVPVLIPDKRGGEPHRIETDEHPRPTTTLEALSKLVPTFKREGTVTPGNSSGLNDGASAVLVLSMAMADRLGMKRKWRIVGSAAVGVDPRLMGIGPIPAIKKVLKQTGMELKDLELFEINEAFSAPSIAVEREFNLNPEIVNVNGGGIALGHPIGNSGCRIVVTLIHEMEKRGVRRGLAALCDSGGHGQATIIERA